MLHLYSANTTTQINYTIWCYFVYQFWCLFFSYQFCPYCMFIGLHRTIGLYWTHNPTPIPTQFAC